MTRAFTRFARALAALLLALCALTGCKGSALPEGAAPDDIITFENNAANKPVIRVGMQYYTPDSNFIDTLEKQFPEYVFVLDYSVAAGTGQEERLMHMLDIEKPLDLVVSSRMWFVRSDTDYFCDLSAESFLNNYLLASLNNVSVDGRIYFLPGVTSMAGMAYNTEMFAERGWEVPTTTDEFFELCDEIKAAGVSPFSNCCKYANQVNRLFGTMQYDKLYLSDDDILWLQNVQQNKASFTGHMEPFYELAKRFADAGIITLDDFSASLTQQRQAFWNGEYAMMFGDTGLYTYAAAEGAQFELGFMPFPAELAENSGYCVTPNYYMAIPKYVEKNPARLKLMKEILGYLSTAEGQHAMLSGNYNISNVKGVDISDNPAFEYVREAYERGNLFPQVEYLATSVPIVGLQQASVKTLYEGATVEQALKTMDDSLRQAFTEGAPVEEYEVIASAEEEFTTLETSYYMADKLREATGDDIALIINGGYFRSNLANFDKGEITSDMRRFIMKGVGSEDWLTTYNLTGAQIKEILEYPIVNGADVDVFIAASGLAVEYAPWNERGSRVLKVTLEDGSPLEDAETYTVSAWAGAIDDKYITGGAQAHDDLGAIDAIMLEALTRDGVIKPDIERRLALVWPQSA